MDLRLVEQSRLVDSAAAIEGLATDHDGRARAIDGDFDGVPVPDIGAYEFRLNLSPRAEAGDDREVWLGEEVVFDGSGSADPDGEIVAWRWDFGDISAGEGEVVRHVYDEESPAGGYRVTLTVVDSDGAQAQDLIIVVARERPDNVLPIADAGGGREAFVDRDLLFDGSGSADPDGEVVAWRWRFGDGDSAEGQIVRHAYDSPGEYFATLSVEDERGGVDEDRVSILVEVASPDAGLPDAAPPEPDAAPPEPDAAPPEFDASVLEPDASQPELDASGPVRDVPLLMPDTALSEPDSSSVDPDAAEVEPDAAALAPDSANPGPDAANQAPQADAGPPLTGLVGVPIAIDGTLSTDPDGEVVAWIWDFGDGGGGVGVRVNHTYAEAGDYTVRLTVRDDSGAEASAETTATIRTLQPPDGAATGDLGPADGSVADGAASAGDEADGGCSCGLAGDPPRVGLLLLLLALGRRRREGPG